MRFISYKCSTIQAKAPNSIGYKYTVYKKEVKLNKKTYTKIENLRSIISERQIEYRNLLTKPPPEHDTTKQTIGDVSRNSSRKFLYWQK